MCLNNERKDMMMNQNIIDRNNRTKWYNEARFGMFIHWGLYAIPARGEWVRSTERIPNEQYDPLINEFYADSFNPKEWAKLAKKAGMKYAVLTAKHHDGFCLFDTKLSDFNSMKAPCHRDIVKEFIDAFRAEGIRVGLYFSIIDWRDENYPHYGDMHHPMRDNETYKGKKYDFDKYLELMHGQVKELVTGYGKLDIMWFDFSYDNMRCDVWKPEQLMKMVRTYQPDIICDNRLEGSSEYSGSIKTLNPTSYAGDFASPEQMIPPTGIRNEAGEPIPWEACITLNRNWGYHAHDKLFKSDRLIIRTLVECVSKNGNLILNVGPNAKGEIPKESVKILESIGEWMKQNDRSITGCGLSDYKKPEWGRYTQNGNKLYAHIFEEQVGAICLEGIDKKIEKMRLLKDGSEILETKYWNLKEYENNTFFFFDNSNPVCYPLPDERDTVVEIIFEEE